MDPIIVVPNIDITPSNLDIRRLVAIDYLPRFGTFCGYSIIDKPYQHVIVYSTDGGSISIDSLMTSFHLICDKEIEIVQVKRPDSKNYGKYYLRPRDSSFCPSTDFFDISYSKCFGSESFKNEYSFKIASVLYNILNQRFKSIPVEGYIGIKLGDSAEEVRKTMIKKVFYKVELLGK